MALECLFVFLWEKNRWFLLTVGQIYMHFVITHPFACLISKLIVELVALCLKTCSYTCRQPQMKIEHFIATWWVIYSLCGGGVGYRLCKWVMVSSGSSIGLLLITFFFFVLTKLRFGLSRFGVWWVMNSHSWGWRKPEHDTDHYLTVSSAWVKNA
jgi:hypothetical protein